ncbi:MFS general substrate transporter [Thozetella sp. PMI_491]|nr:MFS general substrate transporter [Thozetella sp. PMI_491]
MLLGDYRPSIRYGHDRLTILLPIRDCSDLGVGIGCSAAFAMSDSEQTVDLAKQEAQEATTAAPELVPEEGLRGWLCVFGACICIFCTFGFLNAIGVFQTTYQETYLRDYTPSSISWIFAVQLSLMWAPGPLYGRLIDTYGPAPVLYPAAVLCIFSLCMTSLADQYYQIFLAQGLGFGIGAGGVFTAGTVCVGQWFVRRRGLGVGIATMGSGLGGVIFPVFLNKMIDAVGFNGAIRYTALFTGLLLAASCFMIRSRLPRKKWDARTKWLDLSLFRQKPFAFFVGGSYLLMWGLWAPFDFLPSHGLQSGLSPSLSLYLISIINATSVPGRILPPYLADTMGHFNVMTACALVTGSSILALWLPFNYHPSAAGLIVFALVYGFSSGASVSLLSTCVFKLGPVETLGQRFGTFQMVMALSTLTGLPIMGAILDRQNDTDFSGMQLFSGLTCLVGAGLIGVSTYYVSHQKV